MLQRANKVSALLASNKKRRVEATLDEDQTPRATLINRIAALERDQAAQLSPSRSPSPTKSSTRSTASDASSSRRKFFLLDLGNEGIVKRQLTGPRALHLPRAIKDALLRIQRLERYRGVLSAENNTPNMEALLDEFDLDQAVFAEASDEGSRLTPESVDDIGSNAQRCFEMDHDEPVWNAEVHNPLLNKVFRTRGARLVDFSLCTTAQIIKEYLPRPAPDKRIDFCLYIDPRQDPDPSYSIKAESLREDLPQKSINHTSYGALHSYPMTVSVETERSGNNFDSAVLQIAVWQAAHWKMLRSLLHKAAPTVLAVSLDDTRSEAQYVSDALRELGALHGIIIQGHEWYYAATSPELTSPDGTPSLRTILWLHQPIGRTNSGLGIHKIAAFLEFMKGWTASIYWPWFKKHVLN
ncbi:hypothetical protein AK830_g4479 [Neonectria ditissima]|uniref:PD-(D/E)XK nuclease-like domain-containing protein n=1 Tax=Neonectria ditissima TaxID=78410 RepID=A0A0P7AVV2_9HYPO|nr:hypothetical protein AK830_g4479 [Neonectria ditissima]